GADKHGRRMRSPGDDARYPLEGDGPAGADENEVAVAATLHDARLGDDGDAADRLAQGRDLAPREGQAGPVGDVDEHDSVTREHVDRVTVELDCCDVRGDAGATEDVHD